jgi:hypothetical protein
MAPTFEEELNWFRQLGSRLAHPLRSSKAVSSTGEPHSPETSRSTSSWQSFDLADEMEQGMAQEVVTSFVVPLPAAQPARRLVVEHSPDGSQHKLLEEGGETLLLAATAKDGSINIFVPTGGDPPKAVGPAFTLTPVEEDQGIRTWTLATDRCECCEYLSEARADSSAPCRRQLARISHCREEFRQCSIMSMDIELPAACGGCRRAQDSGREEESVRLESRRPRWNQRLRSLTLDFHGRATEAAVQNFQLDLATADSDEADGEPELLYGKVGENKFVLDYKHPLGMAQAFAIALTTAEWY